MVNYCVMCRKTPGNSHGTNRAWHRFPHKLKNPELYQLWLNYVKRVKVCKTATLCSDHFCYNDYKSLRSRRLKDDAVPGKLNTDIECKTEQDSRNTSELDSSNDSINSSPVLIEPEVCLELTGDSYNVEEIQKPKLTRKKLGGMGRSDFRTNEGWVTYREVHLKLKTQLFTLRHTNCRRKNTMDKLLSELKLTNGYKPEEYLELENFCSSPIDMPIELDTSTISLSDSETEDDLISIHNIKILYGMTRSDFASKSSWHRYHTNILDLKKQIKTAQIITLSRKNTMDIIVTKLNLKNPEKHKKYSKLS